MNSDAFLKALDLPSGCLVNQRVPKKLLLEHGAPTAADKRRITEGIEEIQWLAALKPVTIGVPEYRDDLREYLEIAVLGLTLRRDARIARLIELVHRAIPYPVLLLTQQGEQTGVSAVHKRWSQGESGKTVIEGEVIGIEWEDERDGELWDAFIEALPLGKQPRITLHALYQGWIDTLGAMLAARITGRFTNAGTAEQATSRHEALHECARLHAEITRIRTAAAKEKQMAKQVELNLELKRIEAQLATARERL